MNRRSESYRFIRLLSAIFDSFSLKLQLLKHAGPLILLATIFSCSKSAGINENKAEVTITHVAPGFGALDVLYGNNSVLGGAPLSYGQTSGSPGSPYVDATAGVRQLRIMQGTDTLLSGYTSFLQGEHYSVFAYDTLQNDSLKLFILQDNLQLYNDTIDYVRFMNFSPASSLNLVLTNAVDTIVTGFQPFAGNKLDPSGYPFRLIHIGHFGARVFRDTTFANSIPVDSVLILSNKIYTLFLQGYADSSGSKGLMLKSIQYN